MHAPLVCDAQSEVRRSESQKCINESRHRKSDNVQKEVGGNQSDATNLSNVTEVLTGSKQTKQIASQCLDSYAKLQFSALREQDVFTRPWFQQNAGWGVKRGNSFIRIVGPYVQATSMQRVADIVGHHSPSHLGDARKERSSSAVALFYKVNDSLYTLQCQLPLV